MDPCLCMGQPDFKDEILLYAGYGICQVIYGFPEKEYIETWRFAPNTRTHLFSARFQLLNPVQ